jgi:hypothetical protein
MTGAETITYQNFLNKFDKSIRILVIKGSSAPNPAKIVENVGITPIKRKSVTPVAIMLTTRGYIMAPLTLLFKFSADSR